MPTLTSAEILRAAYADGSRERRTYSPGHHRNVPSLTWLDSPGLATMANDAQQHRNSASGPRLAANFAALRDHVRALFGAPLDPDTQCDCCGTSPVTYIPWGYSAPSRYNGELVHEVYAVTMDTRGARQFLLASTITRLYSRTRRARGLVDNGRSLPTVDLHICGRCIGTASPCEDCGEVVDVRAARVEGLAAGAVALCPSCQAVRGLPWAQCVECDTRFRRVGDALAMHVHPNGDLVCRGCSATCSGCGARERASEMRYSPRTGNACRGCSADWQECSGCAVMMPGRYLLNGQCPDCQRASERAYIGDYHSSGWNRSHALPTAWTRRHGGRFFGVELEVEAVNGTRPVDGAKRILTAANNGGVVEGIGGKLLHAERDGSLACGFELVSRPLDLPGHRALWSRVLTPDNVADLRSHNTSTCGLHIHLTRASFTRLQMARMVVCLNAPTWEPLVRAVARRYQTGYCHIARKKLGTAMSAHGGKYDALNVSRERTIEFRIFRGSLNAAAVVAAVEFTHALGEFCGMPSYAAGTVGDLSPAAFLRFLSLPEVRGETRTLRAYLSARGVAGVEAREVRPRRDGSAVPSGAVANESDETPAPPPLVGGRAARPRARRARPARPTPVVLGDTVSIPLGIAPEPDGVDEPLGATARLINVVEGRWFIDADDSDDGEPDTY